MPDVAIAECHALTALLGRIRGRSKESAAAPADTSPGGQPIAEAAPPKTGGAPPSAPTTSAKEAGVMPDQNTGTTPAAGPDGGGAQATPVTEAQLADAVARAEIAERQLAEAQQRQAVLAESASSQARVIAERDAAIAESRRLRADGHARTAIAEAVAKAGNLPEALKAHIGPRITERIVGRVPLTEAGEVNEPALASAIQGAIDGEATYAAQLLEAQGAGTVRGLGPAAQVTELSQADFESQMAAHFRDLGLSEADAKLAAKGR